MKRDREELDRVVASIRSSTVRQVQVPGRSGGERQAAIEVLLRQAMNVVRVASSVSAQADGYSAKTPLNGAPGGGKGGGMRMPVQFVEAGTSGVDPLPTSSTEVAAIAKHVPDPVAAAGSQVLRNLAKIADGLVGLARTVARFEELRSTAAVADPPMCWVAQVRYGLPYDVTWDIWRTTDFAGVLAEPLDEPRGVSKSVYKFVYNHRRLPTKAELLQHLERGTMKVRA